MSHARLIFPISLAALGLLLLLVPQALAGDAAQDTANDTCLACHGQPGLTLTLEDGDEVSLTIDRRAFEASVHGEQGFACVLCHTNVGGYPHPAFSAANRRDLNLQLYSACQPCHANEYQRTLDSAHEEARANGNPQAAICTDCHGAHDTRRLTDAQTGQILLSAQTHIPQTCARCHSAIYEKYRTSVHGSALEGEGNPDVPTCIDCHGVHDIEDPTTAAFRLNSPRICAECHTDPDRMAPYGLSTEVLDTYVADFHGTTVTLFERLTPDAETNKPVCFDCHGVHDIQRVDDPQRGLALQENLLARCQRCHPEATASFPQAWLSHYVPSPDRAPLVYFVELFYKLFIPATLGGMALLVALDLTARLRGRLRAGAPRARPAEPEEAPSPPPPPPQAPLPEPAPAEPAETPSPPPPPPQAPPAETAPDEPAQDASGHTVPVSSPHLPCGAGVREGRQEPAPAEPEEAPSPPPPPQAPPAETAPDEPAQDASGHTVPVSSPHLPCGAGVREGRQEPADG